MQRKTKKQYLDKHSQTHVYEYDQLHVPIPKRLHAAVEPLFAKDLSIDVAKQGDTVMMTIKPSEA